MRTQQTLENVYIYKGTTPISLTFPLHSLGDFFCIYAENGGEWRVLLAFNQIEPQSNFFSNPRITGWILRSKKGISTITYYCVNEAPKTVVLSGSVQL